MAATVTLGFQIMIAVYYLMTSMKHYVHQAPIKKIKGPNPNAGAGKRIIPVTLYQRKINFSIKHPPIQLPLGFKKHTACSEKSQLG
ncbi:MAG: hypothetical protein WAU15_05930 [Nitrosomonas sp.]